MLTIVWNEAGKVTNQKQTKTHSFNAPDVLHPHSGQITAGTLLNLRVFRNVNICFQVFFKLSLISVTYLHTPPSTKHTHTHTQLRRGNCDEHLTHKQENARFHLCIIWSLKVLAHTSELVYTSSCWPSLVSFLQSQD